MQSVLRVFLFIGFALAAPLMLSAVGQATNPAETFVREHIQTGLNILNNKALSVDQRRDQFATFLLGITDMKRIADFTLGQYRRTASPTDLAAFESAFRNYAVAVYQSYFATYTGQTLEVTGSIANAPDDFMVHTNLIDPNNHSGQPPPEVDFRVLTERGEPVVVDVSFSGISLAIEERDDFTAFLGQNGGNISALISRLNELAKQLRAK